MFIKYEDIEDLDVTIDVRTKKEYENMKFFVYNIPIINEDDYIFLKKHVYLAIPIVLKGLVKNNKAIKQQLYKLSKDKKYRIILGCSQGRLRSPIMYLYAKCLGINAKVLKGGIKPFFINKDYNIKNLYGFLDI